MPEINHFFVLFQLNYMILFDIAFVLVLLTFENMPNTHTIMTFGIVFQYKFSIFYFNQTFPYHLQSMMYRIVLIAISRSLTASCDITGNLHCISDLC